METRLAKLKSQLTKRLKYLYIHGRPSILETILLADDWNSAIYRVQYLQVLAEYEKKLRQQMNETLSSLEIEKENMDFLLLLASIQVELKNNKEALVVLEKILEINPENKDAASMLKDLKKLAS